MSRDREKDKSIENEEQIEEQVRIKVHCVEITEIYYHTYLAKISWK